MKFNRVNEFILRVCIDIFYRRTEFCGTFILTAQEDKAGQPR